MKHIFKILTLCGFTAFLLQGCGQKKSFLSKSPDDFSCTQIEEETICTPKEWRLVKQSRFLFYDAIGANDTSDYFVVLKYNKLTTGLSIKKYLEETYKTLMVDTNEKFTGYTSKKLIYNSKVSFYSEYYTTTTKPLITFSMVFENDESIFELALKSKIENAAINKELFGKILFEFKHKNEPIFLRSDKIQKAERIDLSKI